MQLGEDRFRRQEHERRVRRLARHDVSLGDVAHVLDDGGAEVAPGLHPRRVVARLAQGVVALERELGIDADGARRQIRTNLDFKEVNPPTFRVRVSGRLKR